MGGTLSNIKTRLDKIFLYYLVDGFFLYFDHELTTLEVHSFELKTVTFNQGSDSSKPCFRIRHF